LGILRHEKVTKLTGDNSIENYAKIVHEHCHSTEFSAFSELGTFGEAMLVMLILSVLYRFIAFARIYTRYEYDDNMSVIFRKCCGVVSSKSGDAHLERDASAASTARKTIKPDSDGDDDGFTSDSDIEVEQNLLENRKVL